MPALALTALEGVPEVRAGDDLAALVRAALARTGVALASGDVLVVAQKIVSKSEGRTVALSDIDPSPRARALAATTGKDARLVELVLRESTAVLRARRDVIVVEHRCGWITANAGIDASNVECGGERVLLLPADPDATCRRLRAALADLADVGVIVNDSFGRAWRIGTVGVALGVAGLPGVVDLRGQPDRFGRPLRSTELGFADEIAAAASLLMGQADEGTPVVHVRGAPRHGPYARRDGSGGELLRPAHLDLFRT